MTQETPPKYFTKFETFTTTKFGEIVERFNSIEKRLDGVDNILGEHTVQIMHLQEDVNDIKEKVAFIPAIYDAIDAFMKEIRESRDERVLLSYRVSDHGERIIKLEAAKGISVR